MKLELTEAAVSDLRSIRRYTLDVWGKGEEQRYIDMLWERFSQILASPKLYRFRHDLFPDCQVAAAGKHVILFRIRAESLQVVRVLHGAMDFPRHLPKDI